MHAHSSWAGVYARLLRLPKPVLYEPHCYKFDDPLLPTPYKYAFWLAEKVLICNSRMVGVLSDHELSLTRTLSKRISATRILNTSALPVKASVPQQFSKIGMVGRIAPQKDPEFFLKVIEELRHSRSGLSPIWVGDGDQETRRKLQAAGVRVTGWLNETELQEILQDMIYLHTAAYEGFPLSVIDAANQGIPIVARKIPAFEGYPFYTASDPKDIAAYAESISTPSARQEEAREWSARVAEVHSITELRRTLLDTYRSIGAS